MAHQDKTSGYNIMIHIRMQYMDGASGYKIRIKHQDNNQDTKRGSNIRKNCPDKTSGCNMRIGIEHQDDTLG
jgi:hypothetical protein